MHPKASGATLDALRGGLIISCQADPGSPFRDPVIIAAFARAAEIGGAQAVRVQGLDDVRAVTAAVNLPVIGLTKRRLHGSPVYITPSPAEVQALASLGCRIVAFDATLRERPYPVSTLVEAAHEVDALAMADCATIEDARAALNAGVDLISTTLSGYTEDSPGQIAPDWTFIEAAARLAVPCIAEGRISSPQEAERALELGAFAVVVGTAITRPDVVVSWYAQALRGATARQEGGEGS